MPRREQEWEEGVEDRLEGAGGGGMGTCTPD